MSNLFETAAVFGDIHFGKQSDSEKHNLDCLRFIDWFLEQAEEAKADRIIFLGDWFHNETRIRLDTLHYATEGMKRLQDALPTEVIVGNHDMFMKHSRAITSVSQFGEWPGIELHNQCSIRGNVGFVPYLVGTEYLEVLDMEVKYLFGHLELPHFLLNNMRESEDHGGLNADSFTHPDMVFSGHFHKRQLRTNKHGVPTWYIGSPFGHDFNDTDDPDRGMMILHWGEEPEFRNWNEGPIYQRIPMSRIVDLIESGTLEDVIRPTSVLEVRDDMGLELEDISVIRETLLGSVREVRVPPSSLTPGVDEGEIDGDLEAEPLEDIVVKHLMDIDPHGSEIEPELLVNLFKGKHQK